MIQIEKPYLTNFKSFASFDNVFDSNECKYLSSLAWDWQDALTQGNTERDDKIRNSNVFWLEPRQDLLWVWERLRHFIQEANSHCWKMNIEGFHEHIQLTKYRNKGHYDWHVDNGNGRSSFRKLSCVLNLSDPYKYKGGGTLIKIGNKPQLMPKTQGTLNIFPSYTLHKAKKVKKGSRMTLVCWVGGSHYR